MRSYVRADLHIRSIALGARGPAAPSGLSASRRQRPASVTGGALRDQPGLWPGSPVSGAAASLRRMSAQPVLEADPDDPMEILRVLPAALRDQFLREYYAAAALAARQVGGYRQLHDVLRLWRLTAAAQSDPGFAERLAAVRAAVASGSLDGTVPAGEVLPGWR
jgi:hypothetical protein